MAALAKAAPGAASLIGMVALDRDDLDVGLVQPEIKFAAARFAKTGLNHHGGLEHRGGRDQAHRVAGDAPLELGRFGLVERDRHDRRRVDHHQRGNPLSS